MTTDEMDTFTQTEGRKIFAVQKGEVVAGIKGIKLFKLRRPAPIVPEEPPPKWYKENQREAAIIFEDESPTGPFDVVVDEEVKLCHVILISCNDDDVHTALGEVEDV